MEFLFKDEHRLFRKTVHEFVDKEIIPQAQAIDESGEFPKELFKKMGAQGFYGLRYPEEYGGANADTFMFAILCEELARGSMAVAASAMMQSLMGTNFIYKFGTDEHRERLLKPAIQGEKMGCFAITEPGAGSDLGAMQTTAVKDGSEWVLNGTKTWITNGPLGDFFTVGAMTDKSKGFKGIDMFLVEAGTEGFTIGKEIHKLGVSGALSTEISFSDCRIPEENLFGEVGQGFENLGSILSEIRVMTGALSIGIARAALEQAFNYAKEREAFGKPIIKFQAIQFKLASMATELEASKLMVYNTAWMLETGQKCTMEAAMAKLFSSEMANRVADEATRVFASYGFSLEFPVQRYFRDARFLLLGGGTSEILHSIISRELNNVKEF
ncbi:MAG: acyl-CoA dehydrogenase family protein [Thermoplasmata archaeon]|nr:MAG: acyl-CoA dehydrogenase family protein [Thermoplasmata archaeon]